MKTRRVTSTHGYIPFEFGIEELSHRFVLDSIHWVYLTIYCLWCVLFEPDGVIPSALWWVAFRVLLGEYLRELLILFGDFYLLCILLCLDSEFRRGCGA